MSRRALRLPGGAVLAGNVAARFAALASLAVATVLVARSGGPALVGQLTLLRVLPGFAGVIVSCGLPAAVPFFLAKGNDEPRLRPTLVVLLVTGAAGSALAWLVLLPVLREGFFRTVPISVVAAAGAAVFTQLFVAVGKSLLQGSDDMRAANAALVAEEAAFLPAYLALGLVAGGVWQLVGGLVCADVAVAAGIGIRLARRGFFRGWAAPSVPLARSIAAYGLRGQVGGMLALVNLRLDFAILGAIAGPAVLGTYAVASKYAELLRLPGLAVTFVLYPRFARQGTAAAAARTRALLPRSLGITAAASLPLLALAGLVLPLVYGDAFRPAVLPACVLLVGLVGEGVAGVVTAYLYGSGHPGANSAAMGVGVLATVALDLTLIPPFGATGAALASSAAYLLSTGALLALFSRLSRLPVPASALVSQS